jgi:hypothetical protein
MSIIQSVCVCVCVCVCVFVAVDIQNAMRRHHIVISGLPRSTIFFHLINGTIFEKKRVLNVQ